MPADRDLLFGILALQLDLVSREQLVMAMRAWAPRKGDALADVLRDQGALADDDCRALGLLVDRHVARHGGTLAGSLAALRVTPQLREELSGVGDAEVLATVRTIPPLPTLISPALAAAPAQAAPQESRYRPLHSHARGGLGEVFVALDEELGREVALKQIQEQFADHADSRGRFVREAEITGKLEHPGVVPVYGLGRYPDGRPFYAMRFIGGEGLDAAIRRFHAADRPGRDAGERSLALRGLLTRFVAVCNAMAYAHSRGVIHRDLKPANVMLGEFGETLVVDWGLARVLQAGAEQAPAGLPVTLREESTRTRLGRAMGTPAFMPPEQARGEMDRVGVRSDVFALGATLYTLLAGRPPYAGEEVLRQAEEGNVAPARQVNPRVPRALEAVCAKAMARDPQARYASASHLGEDVERWLADEPIRAYREPLPARVRRWGRRHRALVTSAALLLAFAVAALGVGLWAVRREQVKTAAALAQAEENLEQAEANLRLARRAVDECFLVARDQPLLQGPRLSKVRKLLLSKALAFYRDFHERKPDDAAIARERSEQHFRVGAILRELGRPREAMAEYEKAASLARQLAEAHPGEPAFRGDLARTLLNQSLELRALGDLEWALKASGQALQIQREVSARGDLSQRRHLGLMLTNRARQLRDARRDAEARKALEEACALLGEYADRRRDDHEARIELAAARGSLASLLGDAGDHRKALDLFLDAARVQREAAARSPAVATYRAHLAKTLNNAGLTWRDLARPSEEKAAFEEARDLLRALAAADPDVPEYASDLARTLRNLADVLGRLGQPKDALQACEEACRVQRRLATDHPDLPGYQADLARTLVMDLGNRLLAQGRRDDAREGFEEALRLLRKLTGDSPGNARHRTWLAMGHLNLARVLREQGRLADADPHAAAGVGQLQALLNEGKADEVRGMMHTACRLRAHILGERGDHEGALAAWERALGHAPAELRAFYRLLRAAALARGGDHARAAAEADAVARARPAAGEERYALAVAYALASVAAGRDPALPLPVREQRGAAWAARAVAHLAQAEGHFRRKANRQRLDADADLSALRGRDDYRAFRAALPGGK
jgi:serine/threonine-protein kinase